MKRARYIFAAALLLAAHQAEAFFLNTSQQFVLLQSGYGGEANFGDGKSEIVVGVTDTNSGALISQPVQASDFFADVVHTLDTNSFSVINGVVYSKGLLNGGTFPALNTNLAGIFAHFSFATNSRVIIAAVPSFKSASLAGGFSSQGGMTPPTYPSLQISTDGGATWQTGSPQTVPTLVSLYDASGNVDGFTNLIVNSFVNPSVIGGTNDLTSQTVLVTTTADGRSAVSVTTAGGIASSAAAQWATHPATADVNLNGFAIVHSSRFKTVTRTADLAIQADGADFETFTPAITGGAAPFINQISVVDKTNLIFKVSASESPGFRYLITAPTAAVTWTNLTLTTNWQSGGYYFAGATMPITGGNVACLFEASVSGTNTAAAKINAHAQFFADRLILTNASGSRFSVSVNAATNGLVFTPAP